MSLVSMLVFALYVNWIELDFFTIQNVKYFNQLRYVRIINECTCAMIYVGKKLKPRGHGSLSVENFHFI